MRQEIPLSDAELAAFNVGATSLESLLSRLANVPTPAGQTPSQLRGESIVQIDWGACGGLKIWAREPSEACQGSTTALMILWSSSIC
jgi:hypothetical protein